MKKILIGLLAALVATPAIAQWQTQQYAIPIGRGAGVTGFSSAAPGSAGIPLVSAGASANPIFSTAAVAGGGTGRTSLTAFNVLIGAGTSQVALAAPGTAGVPLVSAGAAANPAFGTAVVAGGGTGLTSGTSGGVLCFTGSTTIASSSALTANQLLLGGGAGACPTVMSAGTTTTVLHGNASGAPTFAAVNLTGGADVTGILPPQYGGTGLTSPAAHGLLITNGGSAMTLLAAGTSGYVLTSNGTSSDPSWQLSTPGLASVGYDELEAVVGHNTGTRNYFFGNAGNGSVTGTDNSGFGNGAFAALTTGTENAVFGCRSSAAHNKDSGGLITTSKNNTIMGCGAGVALTSQAAGALGFNVIIGYGAGMWTESGGGTASQENTFLGVNAGNGTTTSVGNTAIGANAYGGYYLPAPAPGPLGTAVTGSYNTDAGYNAHIFATSGSGNVILGVNACLSCTSANNNVVIGGAALTGDWDPTTGTGTAITGATNVVVGYNVTGITTGSKNTIIGSNCSVSNPSNGIYICDGDGNQRIVWDSSASLVRFPAYTNGPIFAVANGNIANGPAAALSVPLNMGLSASATAGALTIAVVASNGSTPSSNFPVLIPRNGGASGTPESIVLTGSTTVTISSGSTLGVSSSTAFRLWVVLFDDGGTYRLGVINTRTSNGIYPLSNFASASSTAEGGAGAADSAGVFYTGTAVSSKQYVVLGFVEWNTSGISAGTWTTTNVILTRTMRNSLPLPGSVIQSVQASTVTRGTASTSTTYTQTGVTLSGSITPSSAANAIRVSATGGVTIGNGGANGGNGVAVRIIRGTSGNTQVGANFFMFAPGNGVNASYAFPASITPALDWPQTTSSQQYTPQVKTNNAATDITFPYGDTADSNAVGSMLMEEIQG